MNENLSDNQKEFISKFLAKEESNKHILIAAIGTGKTTVVLEIIQQILEKNNIGPILLIGVHRALIALFFERIRVFTNKITVIEKKSFLEMDDAITNENTFWQHGWIYISTSSLLKDERFIKRIKGQKWELILFDEANIKDIAYMENISIDSKNVLFTISASEKVNFKIFNNYSITEWNISGYIKEIHSLNKLSTYIIKFSRTQEEKKYLKIISDFLNETLIPSTEEVIEFETPSSWYSIEQILLKIRNIVAHSNEDILSWEGQDYIINSTPEKFLKIENFLNLISNIELDSKVASLNNLINNLQFEISTKILIFINSTASINYLNSLLNKKGFNTKYLHQALNNETIFEEINRFNNSGGILLVNDFILKGLQLSADVFIHYDLPPNENLLLLRYTRIRNKDKMVQSYFLIEEDNASELIKLKTLGII